MSVSIANRCAALRVYARAESATASAWVPSRPVSDWAGAGLRAGAALGAAFGGLLAVGAGLWPVVLIAAVVGGLVGAGAGLGVGALNGAVISGLSATPLLRPTAPDVGDRTMWVAAMTTALSATAFQLALFGWLPGGAARIWLVVLPAGAATFVAG